MEFNFKKKYGQNFLKNQSIIDKIINLIDASENDLIIEIGPGSGALTKKIVKKNSYYIGYEIDKSLDIYLNKLINNKSKIIYEDILNVDLDNILKEYKYDKLYIVGNLPYYITTPIITKIANMKNIPYKQIYMVQNEVGDRLTAKPGTKEYGAITAYLDYFYIINKEFIVYKKEFIPIPKVDSCIISLKIKENIDNIDTNKLSKLIKDAFLHKRKNLKNNLYDYDLDKINNILESHGYNITNRAEDIPIDVFIDIIKRY